MATVAKILAVLCFLFAGLIMCNVTYSFGAGDWSDAGDGSLDGWATTIAFAVLLGQTGFALLLATVGAAAWCVSGLADESAVAARERRAGWAATRPFDASVRR